MHFSLIIPVYNRPDEVSELLSSLAQSEYEKLVLNEQISVIGYMTEPEKGKKIITKGGNTFDITAQGWNAFG